MMGISSRISALALLLAAASPLAASAAAEALSQSAEGQFPERIGGAVWFHDHLWFRDALVRPAGGALVEFDLNTGNRHDVIPSGVVDLKRFKGNLWVLRADGDRYVVSHGDETGFHEDGAFPATGEDGAISLLVGDRTVTVVSFKRLRTLTLGTSNWRVTRVRTKLPPGVQVSVAQPTDESAIYYGADRGEWGGELVRIDPVSGRVTANKKSSGDPVNGIIADPERPGCVIAAIGLAHFMWQGRLIGVCKDDVRVIYERTPDPPKLEPGETELFDPKDQTEPVFAVVSTNKGYWAVTPVHLVHFEPSAKPQELAIPKREKMGGATPILVPTDGD